MKSHRTIRLMDPDRSPAKSPCVRSDVGTNVIAFAFEVRDEQGRLMADMVVTCKTGHHSGRLQAESTRLP